MKIKQFFDDDTFTYTYFLISGTEVIIIDPVRERVEADLAFLKQHSLSLKFILETHVHADHITGAYLLKENTGAPIGLSKTAKIDLADGQLDRNSSVVINGETVKVMETPGHTNTCLSYYIPGVIFTGDCLLIGKCGRTDFQSGDSGILFDSVHNLIYQLPDETIIYPGHDYSGQKSSTVGKEKKSNQRLKESITRDEFITFMKDLDLPLPKKIKQAIPANLKLGKPA